MVGDKRMPINIRKSMKILFKRCKLLDGLRKREKNLSDSELLQLAIKADAEIEMIGIHVLP